MDVKGIKRAEDWDFEMPEYLAETINELVDAWQRNDPNIDCYMDEVEGCARMVDDENDRRIYEYYLLRGYENGLVN